MIERYKDLAISILFAIAAYLKPIEGELLSMFVIFFTNFVFGYVSGMVKGEDFSLRKAVVCIGHATVFFVLVAAIYIIGRAKGQMTGAAQCVSFIAYVVIYFYGLNVLKNCKKMFVERTAPWYVVSFLYFVLRFKFIEKIPYLAEYLDTEKKKKEEK